MSLKLPKHLQHRVSKGVSPPKKKKKTPLLPANKKNYKSPKGNIGLSMAKQEELFRLVPDVKDK
tara:strand:- start:847 stop:1038 length:192 start_codon:yes stop_codon:yes gene_type:complete